MNELSIVYSLDGVITVGYGSIQFKLHSGDYSNTIILELTIASLVRSKYEERYKDKWGSRMAVPPPPMEYDKIVSDIMNMLKRSSNFLIWQVMFA